MAAVFRGRLAFKLLEDPVEVGQGLEADLERDFTDSQIRIQQQILRLFNACPGNKFGEGRSGDLVQAGGPLPGKMKLS